MRKVIRVLMIAALVGIGNAFPAKADTSYPATPEAVVAGFCEAYLKGEGLDSSSASEILRYTTWAETPGWDRAIIVRGHNLSSSAGDGITAEVSVRFDKVGIIESGETYLLVRLVEAPEIKNFRLVRKGDQWRITKPHLEPHIGVDTAIRLLESEKPSIPQAEAAKREKDISALKAIRDRNL
jgi:hypothetical protein